MAFKEFLEKLPVEPKSLSERTVPVDELWRRPFAKRSSVLSLIIQFAQIKIFWKFKIHYVIVILAKVFIIDKMLQRSAV